MIAGTPNFIYVIAAISNSSFYVAGAHFVISDLHQNLEWDTLKPVSAAMRPDSTAATKAV